MSPTAQFICFLIGFVCFVLAAAGVAHPRINFIGAGLAAWIFVPLVLALEAM